MKLQILQLPVGVLQRIYLLMQLEQHKRKQPGLEMLLRTVPHALGIQQRIKLLTQLQLHKVQPIRP